MRVTLGLPPITRPALVAGFFVARHYGWCDLHLEAEGMSVGKPSELFLPDNAASDPANYLMGLVARLSWLRVGMSGNARRLPIM